MADHKTIIGQRALPPPMSWAQRKELLYVVIDVECTNIEHKVTENTFHFTGVNALDQSTKYEVTLKFLHPVNPDQTTTKNIGRCLEFTIYKKTPGPFWSTLTDAKTKLHFLKANFSKWQDESDDEDNRSKYLDEENYDFNKCSDKFDDFNVDDDDSDDNIPSLSQNDDDDDDDDEKDIYGDGHKP